MGRSFGTNLALVMGILFLLWSLIVVAATLSYVVNPSLGDGNEDGFNAIAYVCNPIDFLITFIFFAIWYKRKTREDRIYDMASYLKMYRRIHLDKVAQRMGISLREAEELLPECISQELVKGYLDRFTGEFIWEGGVNQMRSGGKCQNCGGTLDKVVLEGEVMKCPYCHAIIESDNQQSMSRP